MARAAPISIPTARGGAAGVLVVRPQIHHDASIVPPSYEEVTAEHSCGSSSESLQELPDTLLVCICAVIINIPFFLLLSAVKRDRGITVSLFGKRLSIRYSRRGGTPKCCARLAVIARDAVTKST
jgi:hypothetical protein